MDIMISNSILIWILLVAFGVGISPVQSSNESVRVTVVVGQVDRVSRDEVHFSVKVSNLSERPVFLTGINYESGPRLYPVFLEHSRTIGDWKVVAPCMDTPPPDVIKMSPSEAITLDFGLKVPLSGVCKERDVDFDGRFRFRINYFESEKLARTYMKKIFSRGYQSASAALALSEPFEIPPSR